MSTRLLRTNNLEEIKIRFSEIPRTVQGTLKSWQAGRRQVHGGLMQISPSISATTSEKCSRSWTQRPRHCCSGRKPQFCYLLIFHFLRQDVTTRWNSTFLMFERFVVLKQALVYMQGRAEYRDHHKVLSQDQGEGLGPHSQCCQCAESVLRDHPPAQPCQCRTKN